MTRSPNIVAALGAERNNKKKKKVIFEYFAIVYVKIECCKKTA